MQYSDQHNEANLGQLLFGNRSPMKLHVCLKPIDADDESLNSLNPFETINMGVGKRYILAKLRLGDAFVEKYILLNLFNVNYDNDALKEISLMTHRDEFTKVP